MLLSMVVSPWPDFAPLAKEAEWIKDRVWPSDTWTRTRVSGALSKEIRFTGRIGWQRGVNGDFLRVPNCRRWREDGGDDDDARAVC
jgi:hypothetical protein